MWADQGEDVSLDACVCVCVCVCVETILGHKRNLMHDDVPYPNYTYVGRLALVSWSTVRHCELSRGGVKQDVT